MTNRLAGPLGDHLKDRAFEFWSRDYLSDVDRLNTELAKPKRPSAGLEHIPAIPFSSSPFLLEPGNCIAVIGINPKYQDSKKSESAAREQDLLRKLHKRGVDGFNEFLRNRAEYFTESNKDYYWRYFTKFGGHIGRTWFLKQIKKEKSREIAMEVFRRYVFKSDFVPWFSKDANDLNAQSVATSDDPAIAMYRQLLFDLLVALRPKWIQINGFQIQERFLGEIFDLSDSLVTERQFGGNRDKRLRICRVRIEPSHKIREWANPLTTWVLIHGFTNSQSGPQKLSEFQAMGRIFENVVNDHKLFEFA